VDDLFVAMELPADILDAIEEAYRAVGGRAGGCSVFGHR